MSQDGQLRTPECSTQDLGIEPLLVLADLGRVALWPSVHRVHVNHRAFTHGVWP